MFWKDNRAKNNDREGARDRDRMPGTVIKPVEQLTLSSLLLFSHKVMSNSAIPWTAACQASLSFSISRSLLKLTSIESVTLSNHFILCRPILLLLSISHSIAVFSNELAPSIRGPKYWSFSTSSHLTLHQIIGLVKKFIWVFL